MFKTKVLVGLLIVVAVLFAQVGIALAAPAAQTTTPIAGTVQSITTETDTSGVTTILVTVKDDTTGATQTYRLSVETAASLGLLKLDPTTNQPILDPVSNVPLVDQTKVGQPVTVDPTTVITEQPTVQRVNPIAAILASYFGTDANIVNQYHENGFGFGVIAQAMWISQNVSKDASITGLILEAKKSGDYSKIVLSDNTPLTFDGSIPTNWGQFKKALLEHKNNLGIIVSGHAQPLDDTTTDMNSQQDHGNGKGNGKDNGNGNGKGNGNGNGNGNGD